MNAGERLEMAAAVQDAQDKLLEVIEMLKDANRILDDKHAEAYIIDHLEILASDGHGFLSRDYNLTEWINDIENGEGDEDESEE